MRSPFHALMRRHRPLMVQFATFVGVGLTATAAHFAMLAFLVERDLAGPVLASAAGFIVGGTVSYTLNRQFTFNSSRTHAGAVPRFIMVAGVAFVLNALLMELLVHRIGLNYLLAQAITTGLIMIWTFSGYRIWAFAHRAA